jgi:DEAD/DEAH box helicase domain-containing protein
MIQHDARFGVPVDGPIVVFDVETQRLFEEIGNTRQAAKLGLSVAVSYDADAGTYRTFTEESASDLVEQLFTARLVVGFNSLKFDYAVLRPYTDRKFNRLPTLDIFDHLYRRTGYRSRLDTIAKATLGVGKSGDGKEACEMWRDGRIDELVEYCRRDVEVTWQVYEYGKKHGAVFTRDRAGQQVRIPVMW